MDSCNCSFYAFPINICIQHCTSSHCKADYAYSSFRCKMAVGCASISITQGAEAKLY